MEFSYIGPAFMWDEERPKVNFHEPLFSAPGPFVTFVIFWSTYDKRPSGTVSNIAYAMGSDHACKSPSRISQSFKYKTTVTFGS